MSQFEIMIRNNKKLHDKLNKLCMPLFQNFEFNSFFYHFISNDGYGTSFSSHQESFEKYLYKEQFKSNPYARHPHFFQNSLHMISDIDDENYQLGIHATAKKYNIDYKIIFIEKLENGCQGFSFAVNPNNNSSVRPAILNHIPLLECFIRQFKQNGKDILQRTLEYQLPFEKYLGDDFKRSPTPLIASLEVQNKIKFLIQMGILHPTDDIFLSPRQKECMRYLLRGYTASDTALLLNLSKRTVESYIDHIKLKMNCYSKLELFEKFKEIESVGLL